jgi:hypothetical protein
MKRIYLILCAAALLCTSCQKQDDVDISTISQTIITPYSTKAEIAIYVEDQNGYTSSVTVQDFGVYLSEKSNPTEQDERHHVTRDKSESVHDYYEFTATGLRANTTYYALPYVKNDFGKILGEVVKFTTNGSVTVVTKAATEISANSAKVNGSIQVTGNNVRISKRGFLLSAYENPTIGASYVRELTVDGTEGNYSVVFNYLYSSTRYYFRAYVIVDDEPMYGDVLTFTTPIPDDKITIVLNDPTNVTHTSATVSGTINIGKDAKGTVSEVGIRYMPASQATYGWLVYYYGSQISSWTGEHTISGTIDFSDTYPSYYYYMYYIKNGQTYSTSSKLVTRSSSGGGSGSSTALVRFMKEKAYTYVTTMSVDQFDSNNTWVKTLAEYNFGTASGTTSYYEIPAGSWVPFYYYTYSGYEGWYKALDDPYTFNFLADRKYTYSCGDNGEYLVFTITMDGTVNAPAQSEVVAQKRILKSQVKYMERGK